MVENKRCILIADDEPKMVRALRDFFVANSFCVLEAKDGIEALDVFCENSNVIDIILLDVMMPRQDGLTTLKLIRESASLTPVILLTAKGEEYDQLHGFSCGADDYITKPFSPSLLMARVEAVLRRFGKDTQNDIVAGLLSINATTRTVYLSGKELELTRREYDLLYYLMVNRKLTFSREQLLNNVWGYDFEGGYRTVDTHIRQLRNKLGNCADYIKTSNASEEYYSQIGYDEMLKRYQGTLSTFVGPTKILISSDTLQVKDYSRYNWTMFDPEHKKERHATVFPEDKKKAFALGEQMVSGAWE